MVLRGKSRIEDLIWKVKFPLEKGNFTLWYTLYFVYYTFYMAGMQQLMCFMAAWLSQVIFI